MSLAHERRLENRIRELRKALKWAHGWAAHEWVCCEDEKRMESVSHLIQRIDKVLNKKRKR